MKSKRSRISGSSNWSKRGRDAERKSRRSVKLARTQKDQRDAKVLGSSQLLQKIYKGLHQNSHTAIYAGQKGTKIKVGERAGGSVWKTQSSVHY